MKEADISIGKNFRTYSFPDSQLSIRIDNPSEVGVGQVFIYADAKPQTREGFLYQFISKEINLLDTATFNLLSPEA